MLRNELEARLQALPAPDPQPRSPDIAGVYAGKIAHLASALNDPSEKAEAADIMRGLIDKIILRADADALNGHVIELYGEFGAILSLCAVQDGTKANARSGATGVRQVSMVAGARSDHDLPSAQVKMVAGTRFSLNLLTRSAA